MAEGASTPGIEIPGVAIGAEIELTTAAGHQGPLRRIDRDDLRTEIATVRDIVHPLTTAGIGATVAAAVAVAALDGVGISVKRAEKS